MPFTRAQASALLNKSEMRLFDDSRANALRGLDRPALDARITRARAARDRARDLLKRQRGAARTRGVTGPHGVAARTARKEELLVEILGRFTDARKAAPAAAGKAATKKAPARKAPVARGATKKAGTKQTASGGTATKKPATKKTASGGTTTKKAATKKTISDGPATKKAATKATSPTRSGATGAATGKRAAKKPATGGVPAQTSTSGKAAPKKAASRRLTPERALEQTRRLLEAKQERDRTPQPWQSLDPAADHVPEPGYQSSQAARAAQALHEGEARIPSIHGSNSTRDRINQGKRDHRGDNG